MPNDSQQFIDGLITTIINAEAPESVTNEMVGRILDYINKRCKEGNDEAINELKTKLSGLLSVADKIPVIQIDGIIADESETPDPWFNLETRVFYCIADNQFCHWDGQAKCWDNDMADLEGYCSGSREPLANALYYIPNTKPRCGLYHYSGGEELALIGDKATMQLNRWEVIAPDSFADTPGTDSYSFADGKPWQEQAMKTGDIVEISDPSTGISKEAVILHYDSQSSFIAMVQENGSYFMFQFYDDSTYARTLLAEAAAFESRLKRLEEACPRTWPLLLSEDIYTGDVSFIWQWHFADGTPQDRLESVKPGDFIPIADYENVSDGGIHRMAVVLYTTGTEVTAVGLDDGHDPIVLNLSPQGSGNTYCPMVSSGTRPSSPETLTPEEIDAIIDDGGGDTPPGDLAADAEPFTAEELDAMIDGI